MKKVIYSEDPRAYPYPPPSPQIIQDYPELFSLQEPIQERKIIRYIDFIFSLIIFILTIPLWILVIIANFIDGVVHKEHKGPFLDGYIVGSQDRKFIKYKFRVLKKGGEGHSLRRHDYRTRLSEHNPENITCVGNILKKFYLDEVPQIINILKGDMIIIGIRPLAWHHYLRNINQGHPIRKIMKAGLFSATHVRKGESDYPNMIYDYEYTEIYRTANIIMLLLTDLKIIFRGMKMILEGKGI
jgi:lipopolysaccharide/colanic/teichoic acid biosynthesis glycosyltransferase